MCPTDTGRRRRLHQAASGPLYVGRALPHLTPLRSGPRRLGRFIENPQPRRSATRPRADRRARAVGGPAKHTRPPQAARHPRGRGDHHQEAGRCHNALEHAAEHELMTTNPLAKVRWKAPAERRRGACPGRRLGWTQRRSAASGLCQVHRRQRNERTQADRGDVRGVLKSKFASVFLPTSRKPPDPPGLSRTCKKGPWPAFPQVRGPSSSVWQVKDSNLRSFRDGFTVRSHWPLGQPAVLGCRTSRWTWSGDSKTKG